MKEQKSNGWIIANVCLALVSVVMIVMNWNMIQTANGNGTVKAEQGQAGAVQVVQEAPKEEAKACSDEAQEPMIFQMMVPQAEPANIQIVQNSQPQPAKGAAVSKEPAKKQYYYYYYTDKKTGKTVAAPVQVNNNLTIQQQANNVSENTNTSKSKSEAESKSKSENKNKVHTSNYTKVINKNENDVENESKNINDINNKNEGKNYNDNDSKNINADVDVELNQEGPKHKGK